MQKNENAIRVVEIYQPDADSTRELPVFLAGVSAGFPSPADDYVEKRLDLNDLMVKHPEATFFVRVEGESMRDAGIRSGDILIVDRSLEPGHGKIVVAVVNGEFTVKRMHVGPKGVELHPENAAYEPIKVSPESEFQVWGVVTYVLHKAQ